VRRFEDLERERPDMAEAARRLLSIPGVGFGYLATLRADGAPRIHPVNVAIVDGCLFSFLVPSPKRDDLERDGRYALHTTGSETENDEVAISGRARRCESDAVLRSMVAAAMPFPVPASHELFELGIERVLWAAYSTPPSFPPAYHRWPGPAPRVVRDRPAVGERSPQSSGARG
jgi:hypothetical protein